MSRAANGTPVIAWLLVFILAVACTTPTVSTAPDGVVSPSPVSEVLPTTTPTSTPIATTAPTETRASSDRPVMSPTVALTAGTIAATVVDGVRMRSQPRISADSRKLEPLLAIGTKLYVLDGPVRASGYAWYEVAPLDAWDLPSGWVASGDRDGEPWIEPGGFDCPALRSTSVPCRV